jgi:hypothetical protein
VITVGAVLISDENHIINLHVSSLISLWGHIEGTVKNNAGFCDAHTTSVGCINYFSVAILSSIIFDLH